MGMFDAPIPATGSTGGEYVHDPSTFSWDENGNVSGPTTLGPMERNIDAGLDFVESPAVGYGITAGTVAYAGAVGGAAAAGMATLGAGIGLATGYVGGLVGDTLGHAVMSRIPGYSRIAEDGEMPATKGMPIAHTSIWGTIGVLALGALAAVAVMALPGIGLLASIAIAGAIGGLSIGFASAAGQYGKNKGKIETGSPNVFFQNKEVARVSDLISCSDHGAGYFVAEGAETVFANDLPIARIGHKTTCDGTINEGCTTIAIDIDTSAKSLPIDGGWLRRGQRIFSVVADFLPFGKLGRNAHQTRGRRSADADGVPTVCRHGCGDPVDVATGQLIDTRTDLFIPGTIPLDLTRTYAPKASGLMGDGWASTWGQHLHRAGDLTIYQDPEGVRITFHTPTSEVLSSHERFPHLELMGHRDGELFLYDRRAQMFHAFGHRDGDRVLLTGIEDRNKNRVSFGYGPNGLKDVSHSDGFGIDVTSAAGIMRHASLRDHPTGDCVFAWDYSASDQLVEARSAQMGTLKYSYDDQGRIIRWADNKATEVFYAYDHHGRINKSWSTSGHMGVTLDHHPSERFTIVTDAVGNRSEFHYDADGLVLREVDALGGVWLTDWDRRYNVTRRVDPLGHASTYTYDLMGNMTGVVDPTGATQAWEYDRAGLMTTYTDPVGAVQTFTYDDRGNIKRVTDAEGGNLTLRRGEKGEVLRVELPGGGQERIYYDHLMRPRMQVTPDGHETRMRYDVEGRLTLVEDGAEQVTTYDVARSPENPRGSVATIRLPDGATTKMVWDIEGQLSAITDGEGQTRHMTHGAFDLPITSTDASGAKTTLEHDREMRLTAVINAAGERYEYVYDAVGAIIAEKDFSGLVTRYVRDAASRMVKKIAPDGVETDYEYSARGDLIALRVGDAETTFAYDPRGLLTLAKNKDATVAYAYDALGRMVSETIDGREVTSTYAPSTGLRTARGGDVAPLAQRYSPGGLLQGLQIAGHDPLEFQHDARGLEVLRKSGAGFAMAQGYTPNAQLRTQIAGHVDQLPDDARQGMVSISTRYDPGYGSAARSYRSYDWDKAGRAVGITDGKWGQTQLSYDPRGQVAATRQVDRSGYEVARNQFAYDPTRNLSSVQTVQGEVSVETSAGGRVLARGRVFYRYDGCGRVIEKRVEEPGFRPKVWQMTWDGEGRLTRLTTPEGAVWGYGYDPFGRRVRRLKLVAGAREETDAPDYLPPGSGRAYQWDGDVIAAEAPIYADGTIAWDAAEAWVYEPGSFRPVAKVVGEELYYVVTDHIGTPRELVSADGKRTAWRARVGLWGDVADQSRTAANDTHAPVTCDIRFQGQWYDAESGLHYNRHRYYDPDATQYISPDPTGLAGGTRPQGYVSDPNDWVDPFGLAGCTGVTTVGRPKGGTGSNYDSKNGQGLYVLRDPTQNNKVVYVGRGDAPARGTAHSLSSDKGHLRQEIIHNNNLTKAEAKFLEQQLMDQHGGPKSTNPLTNMLNKIRSYSPTNPNRPLYDVAGHNPADAANIKKETFDILGLP